MVHGLDAVAVRLGSDVSVLDVDVHPFVGGLLGICFFSISRRSISRFSGLTAGNFLEPLILQQALKANGPEMTPGCGGSSDLRAGATRRPWSAQGTYPMEERPRPPGLPGKRSGSLRRSCKIHEAAVADIVVVRRSQSLDDAGLDPLPAPAQVAHSEGRR